MTYSPEGHAWQGDSLLVRASVRAPGLAEALRRPRAQRDGMIDEAWLLESETPYTYGDWVGDGLRALVEATEPVQKLLLPASLGHKSYVQRDLGRLGIPFVVADQPTQVAQAHVLTKQIPSYYWGPAQVAAYRRAFGLTRSLPQPGSLLYLSRERVQSEAIGREYPSAQVAEIVRRLGGMVFDTARASPQAFAELASHAETVVADQGSALFGVLQWQTTRVLEITTDRWWHNANLFFARASGVEEYAILVCERYDAAGLQKRMIELLDEIGFFAGLHHNPLSRRNIVLGG